MRRFAGLIASLDRTTKTGRKTEALVRYFSEAPDRDKLWAAALLSGRRPRRQVKTTALRAWAAELAGLPLWLVEESYHVVGDLAEALALLVPEAQAPASRSLSDYMATLGGLEGASDELKRAVVLNAWQECGARERFVFNKLITGEFRVGVSSTLVARSLASVEGVDPSEMTHRLTGDWTPETVTFDALVRSRGDDPSSLSRPYPFFLASPLDSDPAELGDRGDWLVEWKWDGIRAQVVRRGDSLFVWSRGEDLVTERFPEFSELSACLSPGTVLDGEVVCVGPDGVAPFSVLQTRIGRKVLSSRLLRDSPVVFLAYDLLEREGVDFRDEPLSVRRKELEKVVSAAARDVLRLSPLVTATDWGEVAAARDRSGAERAEGVMLKRAASPYRSGRRRGDWWKWKVDPYSVDGVLVYAQRGHGRRANLFTDYTFAVWDGDALVPFAKAYSGLTDREIDEVDAFVKRNTTERFGPVRTVTPVLVFEIGFEGIRTSARHKSGVALRFPRILRWRRDKTPADADTLGTLRSLLGAGRAAGPGGG